MNDMEEFLKTYNGLGEELIDELYIFSCLRASGFDEATAYENIGLLKDLWLKDENGTSISMLSDMLYDNFDNIDTEEMSTREILCQIY